ncbi:hypothetical protein Tco_1228069 [Tanacetum coccineum]
MVTLWGGRGDVGGEPRRLHGWPASWLWNAGGEVGKMVVLAVGRDGDENEGVVMGCGGEAGSGGVQRRLSKPCLWSDQIRRCFGGHFVLLFKTSIGLYVLQACLWKVLSFTTRVRTIELIGRIKHANFDLKTVGNHRKLQLNELNELRDQAYENYLISKERTKKLHHSKIKNRIFNVGDQVLLSNSCLKDILGDS